MTYQKTLEEGLKNADIKLESAKWAFLTYGNVQGFKDHIKYADKEIAEIKSFLTTFAEKIRGSVVGETLEIVEKERETWARESIGERAVVSVCTAIEQLKDK